MFIDEMDMDLICSATKNFNAELEAYSSLGGGCKSCDNICMVRCDDECDSRCIGIMD